MMRNTGPLVTASHEAAHGMTHGFACLIARILWLLTR